MKAIEQYFHVVLFVFDNFTKFPLGFELGTLGSERVNKYPSPFPLPPKEYAQEKPLIVIVPLLVKPYCCILTGASLSNASHIPSSNVTQAQT